MNESWKTNGQAATEQDCRKYQHCGTRLLATSENWNQILEVQVTKITPGGMAYVSASGGPFGMGTGVWMTPEDLIVIEILPDVEIMRA